MLKLSDPINKILDTHVDGHRILLNTHYRLPTTSLSNAVSACLFNKNFLLVPGLSPKITLQIWCSGLDVVLLGNTQPSHLGVKLNVGRNSQLVTMLSSRISRQSRCPYSNNFSMSSAKIKFTSSLTSKLAHQFQVPLPPMPSLCLLSVSRANVQVP